MRKDTDGPSDDIQSEDISEFIKIIKAQSGLDHAMVWTKKEIAALMTILAMILNRTGDRQLGDGQEGAANVTFVQRDRWWRDAATLYADAARDAARNGNTMEAVACMTKAADMINPDVPPPWPDDFDPDSGTDRLGRALRGKETAARFKEAAEMAQAGGNGDAARSALDHAAAVLDASIADSVEAVRIFVAEGDPSSADEANGVKEGLEGDMASVQGALGDFNNN